MPAFSSKRSRSTSSKNIPSRSALRRRLARCREQIKRICAERDELQPKYDELQQRHREVHRQLEMAIAMLAVAQQEPAPATDPLAERPLPGHQFSVHMIALAIELGKEIGFRPAERALRLIFQALGRKHKVPSHDVIQQWSHRIGVGELRDTFVKGQRVLWMVDHSCQIGKEKVLLIIGIALEDLPPPGQTLPFEKLKVLTIQLGTNWTTEDVKHEYQRLAQQIGAPVYLVCDGASELRDAAKGGETKGKPTIVLGDLKHHAANLLEKHVGRRGSFNSFLIKVAQTRNQIQQTELSHFAPPPLKRKSRFMNMDPVLRWSVMILYQLNHPESAARRGISPERMEQKLGWVRMYASFIKQWSACQRVINRSLWLINHHGLNRKTGRKLAKLLAPWCSQSQSVEPAHHLALDLIRWVRQASESLHKGDRAWLSTEILESLFGRFKQLERQHSRAGFTRLLAALPTLCRRVTGELVRRRFATVKADDVKAWITNTLGQTFASRRNIAYHESRLENCAHV